MKKILFLITIFFYLGSSIFKLNSMEQKPSDLDQVIQGIFHLAIDNQHKKPKTVEGWSHFFTLRTLFDLHIQAVEKAYEALPSGSFKEELDKYLIITIKNKIVCKKFDEWLNQFEIGSKFRKKILEETIKILISIKSRFENHPEASTLRTIATFFYYKLTKPESDFNFRFLINCASVNRLNFCQKFSPKFKIPIHLLGQLLEIAIYLYDQNPIRIIDLSSNELEYLPETIVCLSNVEKIYIDGNKLKTLPQGILKLSKLKKIVIDKELFTQLSQEFIYSLLDKGIKVKVTTSL